MLIDKIFQYYTTITLEDVDTIYWNFGQTQIKQKVQPIKFNRKEV